MAYVVPVLFVVLMWWFSTGAVLWLAGKSDGKRRAPLIIMTGVGILGLAGVYFSAHSAYGLGGPAMTYVAVLSALAVWAFIEFTFLTGALTGSRLDPCPSDISEAERFRLAFHTISYHEYALVAGLICIALVSLPGGGGITAFAIFAMLWIMRISAKLTLFSGAPKFALDMMPNKLAYLQTYFRHDRIGPIFWLSMFGFTLGFLAAVYSFAMGSIAPEHTPTAIMLTTLLGLGVIEHWFMVLPIADSALWQWAMPQPRVDDTTQTLVETPSKQNGDQHSFRIAPGYSSARQNKKGVTP